jgi:hypothetical protein
MYELESCCSWRASCGPTGTSSQSSCSELRIWQGVSVRLELHEQVHEVNQLGVASVQDARRKRELGFECVPDPLVVDLVMWNGVKNRTAQRKNWADRHSV